MTEPTGDASVDIELPEDTQDLQPEMPKLTWKSVLNVVLGMALAAALIIWGLPWLAKTT